ncbi:HP1 family phage holin [Erwinia pyrifoliae]|uniref:Phage holin family protein n=1 Tax=Erwinia pyrifoliae TaxID=79967 RepID=A0ABY5XF31_ERWPY|nr:HP1 family phage holin [Erwinia pyrifoliae]AUX74548.1 hypothetical protein CPI84_15925 [Erwinia pyrifoliae]MCA8875858.1 hypothetical protein [Erwinia pyrifoliae]MCT2387655.1 phage holin family protein [Erwinia pyrifoliae]MCU8585911.1 phage holin family protein [Erwinia pyrifoliae]UWS31810.1 phage holin family protein [Erwinia pyrifoliae]
MCLERVSALISYNVAVQLTWLGHLSLKDVSTLAGMLTGILMLAINWHYKHKSWQLLRRGQITRGEYESFNR